MKNYNNTILYRVSIKLIKINIRKKPLKMLNKLKIIELKDI